jgi:hypothetical protein
VAVLTARRVAVPLIWLVGACTVDYDQLRGHGDAAGDGRADAPADARADAAGDRAPDAPADAPDAPDAPDAAEPDAGEADGPGADLPPPADVMPPADLPPDAPPPPFAWRRAITIARGKVGEAGTARLTDFPLLVSVQDADLRSAANGGQVASAAGDDLVFRALSAATCAGPAACTLDHELEAYDPAAGRLIAWVRVPALQGAAAGEDSVVYLYYGAPSVTSPSQRPAAVWGAYGGVWHLGEGAGALARDATSNGNDATGVGGPRPAAAGQIGLGVELDGAGAHLQAANSPSLGLEASGTVSLWYRTDTAGDWRGLFSKGPRVNDADAATNYALELDPMDQLSWYLGDATRSFNARSGPHPDTTSFHHVAMVWDQGILRRYYDGALVDNPVGLTVTPARNDLPLRIGIYSGDLVDPFDGTLDEIRVSAAARATEWVVTEFRNQSAPGSFHTLGPAAAPP